MKHAVPNTNVDKGVCSYDQTQVFKINGLVTLPFDESALVKGWQISGIFAANSGLRMNIQDGYDEAAGGTPVALTPPPDYMPGCQVQVGKVNELYNPQCFTLKTPGTRRRQLVRGRRWAKRSGRTDPDFFRAPAPDPVCIEVSVLIYTDLGAEDDPGELGTLAARASVFSMGGLDRRRDACALPGERRRTSAVDEVKAGRVTIDYDTRYGRTTGPPNNRPVCRGRVQQSEAAA